jgi:hypothetical protein
MGNPALNYAKIVGGAGAEARKMRLKNSEKRLWRSDHPCRQQYLLAVTLWG